MNLNRLKAVDICLRHLTTAISTSKLYSAEHKQVKKLCRMAHSSLLDAIGEQENLSLIRVDEHLAIDKHPLERSMYIERFARLIKMSGIGHIKFSRNVTFDELYALLNSLAGSGKITHSSENIRLGQVEVRHRSVRGVARAAQKVQSPVPEGEKIDPELIKEGVDSNVLIESAQILENISSEELSRVMEVYEAVKNNRSLQVAGLSEIVSGFIDVFSGYADPLLTLVPLRNMDEYTFTHSLNVCLLNLAQATALGIEGQLLHDIGLSAMLHDVGKLFIPEEVLNKPGNLDEKEWALMQTHPVRGAEYLLDSPGVPRMAVLNAYEHHLRFDLRGYPLVKDGWQQNLCSQLTSVSDVYDSLRTKRPYREPIELDVALYNIERLTGTQLHPLLVENFLLLMKNVTPKKKKVAPHH
jgi:HD-GYP domain-containing protein (c-di-GMP phosphodiesterase class II)